MNQIYSEELFDTFPEIFDRRLLVGGIDCQDGWFVLLGEFGLQAQCLRQMTPSADFRVRAIFVEEGMLHIRHQAEAPFAGLVQQFQQRSKTLCELDGNPAVGLFACQPRWHRYLCRRCAELHELMMVEKRWPMQYAAAVKEDGRVLALSAAA